MPKTGTRYSRDFEKEQREALLRRCAPHPSVRGTADLKGEIGDLVLEETFREAWFGTPTVQGRAYLPEDGFPALPEDQFPDEIFEESITTVPPGPKKSWTFGEICRKIRLIFKILK